MLNDDDSNKHIWRKNDFVGTFTYIIFILNEKLKLRSYFKEKNYIHKTYITNA